MFPIKKERYLMAFLISFITAMAFFLPFLIMNKGIFLFYGDFNVQQVPFYQLAHDAVRSGSFGWNWGTDLGVNFIGSYSFYLLGSPFFWLTFPFPTAVLPYLMAPLLALKFGIAALTGYGFIRRFVKNKDFALIGALLYSFSGFSIYNIFFNHFHDVIALFPLLLIAMEEFMQNDRKGLFAMAVAINALTNYFFFAGQVVFLLLYFIVRSATKGWKFTIKKLVGLAIESVIGVMIACVLLIPSYLAISKNPRMDGFLTGFDFWLYWEPQKYPAILQSFFFPPEMPPSPAFFPKAGIKWASVAGYLPLFGMTGVLAFLSSRKKSFLKTLFYISLVMAMVPGLNSSFFAFKNSYYGRWFYMPILLMALMTAVSIERSDCIDFRKGFRRAAVITGIFIVAIGLTPVKKGTSYSVGIYENPGQFFSSCAIAVCALVLVYLCMRYMRGHRTFVRNSIVMICVLTVITSVVFIAVGVFGNYDHNWIIDNSIKARDKIVLDDDESFYRVDVVDGMDNQAMFWNLPTIQAFHSIVPASVMEFYPTVGVERGVGSRPEPSVYDLRPFLSVKYAFIDKGKEMTMPGFSYHDTQYAFDIYKNDNYIPMGFTYDNSLTRSAYDSQIEKNRSRLLLDAIVLDDDVVDQFSDILDPLPADLYPSTDEETYTEYCLERKNTAAHSFVTDRDGFTSKINLPKENLVFFSVPFDEGWSATVNGEPAEIIKANIGFMAVKAPAGQDVEIRFTYKTPGLTLGLLIAVAGVFLLLAYLLVFFLLRRKRVRIVTGPNGIEDFLKEPKPYLPPEFPQEIAGEQPLFPEEDLPQGQQDEENDNPQQGSTT